MQHASDRRPTPGQPHSGGAATELPDAKKRPPQRTEWLSRLLLRDLGLEARFLLIIGTASMLVALVIWGMFDSVAERLLDRVGGRFAEKQVLYDKARTLQPLIREVALAREVASNTAIRQWVRNEGDPKLRLAALAELERFRGHFQDGSYFLAMAESGHYYFNNARGEFVDNPLRYTLKRGSADDAWFYATLDIPQDYNINVDFDSHLNSTKVWINVLLRDGDKVLAVLGTGLDLTEFIRNVADISQPGITNLFLNQEGAIQIYRDTKYINLPSVSKPTDKQRSVDQLLAEPEDRLWVRQAIAEVMADNKRVATRWVQMNGKRYLAGIAALPEVGWFDVTLLDLDVLLPTHEFLDMALVIGGGVLLMLLILGFTLHRLVLRPMATLAEATAHISQGDFIPGTIETSSGEFRQLVSQFNQMSDSILKTRHWLEAEVAQRTEELHSAQRMLEISLRQAQEGRVAQTNLLALMAHEVRSPVAVIGNTAQMLNALASQEKPEWQPRLNKIEIAVRQLAHLMDEILGEHRLVLTCDVLTRESADLGAFCLALQNRLANYHRRTIGFEPGTTQVSLDADWQLLDVALANLIGNAVKYSPPDSPITLRMSAEPNGDIWIEVHNQGTPLSDELRAGVFGKFIRGQETVDGVGLGLYLVRWIAQLHGGRTEVRSDDDGNTFRLIFPASHPTGVEP